VLGTVPVEGFDVVRRTLSTTSDLSMGRNDSIRAGAFLVVLVDLDEARILSRVWLG